jgi:hypothetical protein
VLWQWSSCYFWWETIVQQLFSWLTTKKQYQQYI